MLNKLRENIHIRSNFKIPLTNLFLILEDLRKESEIIAICPSATKNSWQGVLSATLGLFPKESFIIPQYFSRCIYSENELKKIGEVISNLNFERIIFSGYCSYFSTIMKEIKRIDIKQKFYVIYHGSFASNSEEFNAPNLFKEMLDYEKSNLIHKIGFVKKGMSETLRK